MCWKRCKIPSFRSRKSCVGSAVTLRHSFFNADPRWGDKAASAAVLHDRRARSEHISHHTPFLTYFFRKLAFQRVSPKLHFIELFQCLAKPSTYAQTLSTPTPESATVVT